MSFLKPLTRVNQVANQGNDKLQGIPELRAALEAIGTEVATKVGRRADRLAANKMAAVMKATAPVSDGNQSPGSKKYGRLKDNIRVRLARARKEGVIVYNVTAGRAFWGFFQEFGTKNMPARPWMRPAFDTTVQAAIDTQINELLGGIETTAKRAARLKGPR